MQMSKYDENAIKEIHAWKNPELGWFGQVMKTINYPLEKAGDFVLEIPRLGEIIQTSVQGLVTVCNDMAQWSVNKDLIYKDFIDNGHEGISGAEDIKELNLEDIDAVVGMLDAKYRGMALVEGGGLGTMGAWGIPPDLVALISLNLRAIGEYATYYGFDPYNQEERLFIMNVLGLASSPTDSSKTIAMAQLVKIAEEVAKKRTWKELEKHAFVQVIQQISKAIGIRLTKAKLAQVIPVAGAIVGGGFNAYFTTKVCDAAYYLYRERFLAEQYGADIIYEVVKPAEDIDPNYPEEDEDIPDFTA
jgi:hypothetical protein